MKEQVKSIDKEEARRVLEEFLAFPLTSAMPVLEKFAALPGAIAHYEGRQRNFVYVPGSRPDRVVLAAHADTVWDGENPQDYVQTLRFEDGVYRGVNQKCGIGADDRAGCAMLWLLRESGHSLLILDGEEIGQRGAGCLVYDYPALSREINEHAYIVQLDRRGNQDYKVYFLPVSMEFRRFIERETGYVDAGRNSFTDICTLCTTVCGVNLSVGYYDEHHAIESLRFDDWMNTLGIVNKMIAGPQRRYPLTKRRA